MKLAYCYQKNSKAGFIYWFNNKKNITFYLLVIFTTIFIVNSNASGQELSLNLLTYSTTEIPYIYPRSIWADTEEIQNLLNWLPNETEENESGGTKAPNYAKVNRIVIHDTGCNVYLSNGQKNPNCNGPNDNAIALIKSIFKHHAVKNGWGDIGYNYIIDRKGRIYEGKYGGNGVRGAHVYDYKTCSNFNIGTIGIVVLGNYEKEQPPEIVYKSLARLVAWLAEANNLNPANENIKTIIWQNPKKNGIKCDLENGSFSYEFQGPVVLGHNDIEKTNSDPGKIDLKRVRKEANYLVNQFKNYYYSTFNSDLVYKIEDGFLKEVGYKNDWQGKKPIIILSQEQLGLFQEENQKNFTSGALLKSYTMNNVYLLGEDKKLHLITSPELFNKFGFKWENVKQISDRNLATYQIGKPLLYPDGTLIKDSKQNIYLVEGIKKRKIASQEIFIKNGYQIDAVVAVSDEDLENYDDGPDIDLANGSLIKGSSPIVYYIENGKKRPINSLELFNAYKFKWSQVKVLNDSQLNNYPTTTNLYWPDKSLIMKDGDYHVYYMKNGIAHWIQNINVFKSLKLNWRNIVKLTASEFNQYLFGAAIKTIADYKNIDKLDKEVVLSSATIFSSPTTTISQVSLPNSSSVTNSMVSDKSDLKLKEEPRIRIGIYKVKEGASVQIQSKSAYKVEFENGETINKPAGSTATILYRKNGIAKIYADDPHAIFKILNYNDIPNWNKNINYNEFRGKIEIKYSPVSKSVWVINDILLEDYLKGVGEALNNDPIEYQKTFAIISRSYALYHLSNGGKYKNEFFHLNNTSSDQLYKGYIFEKMAPNLIKAIQETEGLVLKYNNQIARALYSSGAPTKTRNACELWDGEFCDSSKYGYLKGGIESPRGAVYKRKNCDLSNHCVGLMADGARFLAQSGKNFEEILKYYYPEVSIEKIY